MDAWLANQHYCDVLAHWLDSVCVYVIENRGRPAPDDALVIGASDLQKVFEQSCAHRGVEAGKPGHMQLRQPACVCMGHGQCGSGQLPTMSIS